MIKDSLILFKKYIGDAPEVYTDCSKADKLLKWKAELTLDDMIKDSL